MYTIRLANVLADEEIAQARDGYIITGAEEIVLNLFRTICKATWLAEQYFSSLLKSNFCSTHSSFIFLLGNKICMLDFQPPSSKREEGGEEEEEEEEEEEIPSPHHAGSSSSSFMETYPHFLHGSMM